jgi:hypothetical protein
MAGYGRQVGQAVGMVDGQLRGAGATGPVRPSLGRGGSPKLEKMSTMVGERKRAAATGARVHRTRGEAVGRRWGEGVGVGNKRSGLFVFLLWQPK